MGIQYFCKNDFSGGGASGRPVCALVGWGAAGAAERGLWMLVLKSLSLSLLAPGPRKGMRSAFSPDDLARALDFYFEAVDE